MNWLDKTIGYVFPEAGLRRFRARAALGVVRAYDAATTGRRGEGWRATNTSANAEIAPALATVRARAREQIRNNPYAKQAINKLVVKTVGIGITAKPQNKQLARVWSEWIKVADFEAHFDYHGLQMLMARAMYESGEVLVRRVVDRSLDGVPLRLQVLEGDYLDASKHGPMPNGNRAIAGVEVDKGGRRVAYWLFDHHPGGQAIRSVTSTRVDASEVIHLYEKERPGQLRGMPRLATSLMKLRDMADYQDAELLRKKIEACFVAFVTTNDTNRTLANEQTQPASDGGRVEGFSPGMIEYMKTGESVTFGNPSPTGGYGEYSGVELHAIAAGAGVTYEQLTGDLSGTNLSSIRAGMIDFNEMIDQTRYLTFIPIVCDRIYGWFVDLAYLAGLSRTNSKGVIHTPPKRQFVDPIKDIQANRLLRQGGLESTSAQIRAQGDDPDETFQEISEENKRLKELGIVIDTDPGNNVPAQPLANGADPGNGDGTDPSNADGGDPGTAPQKKGGTNKSGS